MVSRLVVNWIVLAFQDDMLEIKSELISDGDDDDDEEEEEEEIVDDE